jgi:hypothetical protein
MDKHTYSGPPWQSIEHAVDGILSHFKREFPKQPHGVAASCYAKKNCKTCYGRGAIVRHVVNGDTAKLQSEACFCSCVQRHLAREGRRLWMRQLPYYGPVGPGPETAQPLPEPVQDKEQAHE